MPSTPLGDADSRAEKAWRIRLEGLPGPAGLLGAPEARAFAEFALNKVSRTFALNIRALPEPLRGQVLHAYLYCRMADTLEDDAGLPASEKARLLAAFSDLFDPALSPAEATPRFAAFPALLPEAWRAEALAREAGNDWERRLLAHAPVVLAAFPRFPAPARAAVSRCVREMCAGMADFAGRAEARREEGRALIGTVEELDAYCYYVAGTVGVMLCDLFVAHARIPAATAARMRALCVSFGLGLQLTNILKDVGDDRARGISWLPESLLAAEGLAFADFFKARGALGTRAELVAGQVKAVQAALFAKARAHLVEALEYSILIPRRERSLRLFCLWPLFMAAETLALLAESPEAWNGGARAKIARARVKRIVLRTGLLWFSNAWLRAEFRSLLRRLDAAFPPGAGA